MDVALVYPYVDPQRNRSMFRFPPLGLGYLASTLREKGFSVNIVDATFIGEDMAIRKTRELKPRIIGIYSMFTMKEASFHFARALHGDCKLLVAGGPLPTIEPEAYLADFDAVAVGEGEKTLLQLGESTPINEVNGLVYRERDGRCQRANEHGGITVRTPSRAVERNLDSIPLPARDLFDNENYLKYYKERNKAPTTSAITSRGCPFTCDFCSHPIFGESFRERSPKNIADEVDQILSLGYERVFFQDDCFTLVKGRVAKFCDEVDRRGLTFKWQCLSRVDNMDIETAKRMHASGCDEVFFGLESGSERILKIMNKSATPEMGKRAVEAAKAGGLKTGAFFIFGYPGDDDDSMLETLHFASNLPLDYLSFSYPYPIPGTPLYERVKARMKSGNPEPQQKGLIQHQLIYYSEISDRKLRYGIISSQAFHYLKRYLGSVAPVILAPLQTISDGIFRKL